jgi:uncharacterized protein (TIGR02453 family)
MSFNGFSNNALEFLIENKINDSKFWFNEHKSEYNDFVLTPLKELVEALTNTLLEIDPFLEVTPAVGKTISRIYRDTRFSKDKSFFRDNMWLAFSRHKSSGLESPSFYFDIHPGGYGYGMGYYAAPRECMQIYRERISQNHPAFLQAMTCYNKQHTFKLMGEKYKRPLAPELPDSIQEWHNRKNIYFENQATDPKKLFTKELVEELQKGYRTLQPIYEFLVEVREGL